jgi:hypothetical protein
VVSSCGNDAAFVYCHYDGTGPDENSGDEPGAAEFWIALALVPLLIFTSNSQLMGDLVNTLWVKRTGWVIVGVVVLLNGWLLVGTIFGL